MHSISTRDLPDVVVVGPATLGTEAIAWSLSTGRLTARSVPAGDAARALDNGAPGAVVLVAGPGLEAAPILAALARRPSTVLIVVTPNPTPPPMSSELQPVVVSSLDELHVAVSKHVCVRDRSITERHVEILQQLAAGSTPTETADVLGITVKTLNNHLGEIYKRLGTPNVTQAVLTALRHGLIRLP